MGGGEKSVIERNGNLVNTVRKAAVTKAAAVVAVVDLN